MDTTMDRDTLGGKLLPELQQIAQTMGVEGAQKLRKAGLIDAIVAAGSNGGGERSPLAPSAPRSPPTTKPRQRRQTTRRSRGRRLGDGRRRRAVRATTRPQRPR